MKMFKLSSVYPTASALFSAFFLYLSNDNFSRFDHFANVSQEVQHNHHCIAANWLPKLEWKSFDFVLIASKNKQPWPFQGRAPLQIQMKIGKKIRVRTALGLCDGWDGPLNLIKRNQKLDRLERRRKNDFFFSIAKIETIPIAKSKLKSSQFFFFCSFYFCLQQTLNNNRKKLCDGQTLTQILSFFIFHIHYFYITMKREKKKHFWQMIHFDWWRHPKQNDWMTNKLLFFAVDSKNDLVAFVFFSSSFDCLEVFCLLWFDFK